MRTSLTALCALVLPLGFSLSPALASPGDSLASPGVVVLGSPRAVCAAPTAVCVRPGSPDTLMAPSLPSAAHGSHAAADLPPRFARRFAMAPLGERSDVDDQVPWTLDVGARLRKPALAGNAVFLVYDSEDPKALGHREVVRAWQAEVPAGTRLAARFTLSPNDGFRPGHGYRIRIVQIVRGKEVLLSDAPLQLL